jgi:spore coat protein CotH
MKHTPKIVILLSALALLSSCGGSASLANSNPSSNEPLSGTSMGGGTGTSVPTSSVETPSPSYEDFWAGEKSLSVSLTFTNASLYALSNYGYNYDQKYADLYFPATFKAVVDGKTYTYEDVGVRMKGNTSRADICSSDGTIKDVCHFKVSFKCTFDDALYDESAFSAFKHSWNDSALRKARKARRFATMSKLDLKYLPRNDSNSSSYATYSQEMYCFHVFEQEGIVAPKAKWASLTFKDDKASKTSSYEAIEAVDEDFISHHFSSTEAGGDLYKCSTYKSGSSYIKADLTTSGAIDSRGTRVSSGKIGVEDCYNLYHPNYQLKTNDDGEKSDFSKMANFISVVNSVKSGKSPQNALENVLDVQEFLAFEGVSYTLGNFDDQRNNYNNYFIYFRANDGKAVYIPYDWDWAFGGSVMSSSQSTLKPYHTSTTHDSSNTNPLYWCTILSNSSLQYSITDYRSAYAATIKKVVSDGYLESGTYSAFASALAGSTLKELSQVSSYMASKKSVIASSL